MSSPLLTNAPTTRSLVPVRAMLLGVLAAVGLSACQGMSARDRADLDTAEGALGAAAAQSRELPPPPAAQPPPAVMDALLPPISDDLPQERAAPRFDVSVNNAPAQRFFMGLVEGTDANMMVHPAVEGSISLKLKNVTIDEVMEAVRHVYGYEYERTRGGYQVLPRRLQSRTYQVNYLNLRRNGESRTRVSSGQVSERVGNRNNGASGNISGGSSSGANITQLEPSTKIETRVSSDFWAELQQSLSLIVGDGEGRSVIVSPQTGIVVVRALPSELREVDGYLQSIQGNLARQVILEAKIVEVELSDRFQAGINWTLLGDHDGDSALVGNIGGGSVFDTGLAETAGSSIALQNASPITGLTTSAFGGTFALAANIGDFNAFLELLKTQGDVQVLSSPRVATVNNQQAVIKVGSDEFFVTDVSSTTTAGTAVTQSQDVELTPFFSGIALDVTPQIDENGVVTLHIHPSVTLVTDQTKEIIIGGVTQLLPLARSTVREADSVVQARSGQVIVIGGLMETRLSEERAKAPVLGDLPLIGQLFRHRKDTSTKTELVILLRPVVVESNADWARDIDQARERIGRLQDTGAEPARR